MEEETIRIYLNDKQSPIARNFWKEVSEIRVDPFNRVKGVSLSRNNKIYKDLLYRECKRSLEHLSAYATWRNISPIMWMAKQHAFRGIKIPDKIGDFNDGVSV